MSKKPKVTAPENKNIGISMNRKANEIALAINSFISPELDALSRHKEAWEGGKFAVMTKLTDNMTPEQIDELPDPKADTGNNPAWYKIEKFKDGKANGWKEVYFYKELTNDLPGIQAKLKRINQLQRSMKDPASTFTGDIGNDIKDLSHDYRIAEIKRLETEISNAHKNVVGAFELRAQLVKFEELKHVSVSLITAIGPDGQPLDGKEDREFKIDPTLTPIVIRSTVKGREDKDYVHVPVGTFLRYDVEKAKEGGGTYAALEQTIKREAKTDVKGGAAGNVQDTSKPQAINTADTFAARMMDIAEFTDRVWSEKTNATFEALRNAVHGAGSDDTFTSCRTAFELLKSLVGSPKDDVRWQAHINEDKEHPLHKAA